MANSNSVVTIDQRYIDSKHNRNKSSRKKTGQRNSHANRKKLYTHSSKQALNPQQVERLIDAAMHSPRSGIRDAALIMLAYRHGLKVSELINLKWEHIDFENQSILVSRLRNGRETLHPLEEREINLLRKLEKHNSELVFQSQRKNQMSSNNIRKIIRHAGEEAGFKNTVYPTMLSGAAGFDLIATTSGITATRH